MSERLLRGQAHEVAPRLLGARVTSLIDGERVTVRLTEVEAYGGVGEDPGSHAFRGRTPRNSTMFARAGIAYVYFTYGMHWCVNVVTGVEGTAAAVLLRAGEVVEGIEVARDRRTTSRRDADLASGPARLAVALGAGGDCDGIDLLDEQSPVRLALGRRTTAASIGITTRTGVTGAGAVTPWRFHVIGDPTVSRHRPGRLPA